MTDDIRDDNAKAASDGSGPAQDGASEESAAAAEPQPDPLEQAKQEIERLRDQLLRTLADFDNYRKRSRRELGDAEQRAREDLLRDLLPVFDNLERAVSHAESATDVRSLLDGIQMVMRQFVDTLAKMGVERVPSVGAAFDPTVHEAIQHLETDEHPPGSIAVEVQGGYRRGERLLRPAMVIVAKAPTKPTAEGAADRNGAAEDA